ncbi:ABC transporter ATP-binding protein [bacterium]|nr:MAG: ABC transporter ATP-binding protein [bacterium]
MKYASFYRYLLPFWRRELLILVLSSITMLLGLVNPYLAKLIIDRAYANKDIKLFIILFGIGGIVFVLSGLFNSFSNYLNRYIKIRLNFDFNRRIFKKLQKLPYASFLDSSTGEHLYKISYDAEQSSRFMADILPQAVELIPKSVFIFLIIFYMNFKIALLTLVLTPSLYAVSYYFNRRIKKAYKAWVEDSQGIFKRLQEVLSHIQLVKAFGKERRQTGIYVRSLVKNMRFNLGKTKLEAMGLFANSLVNRIILGLILFYGGYQVIIGQLTFGSLSAIIIYLSQLSGIQGSLAKFFQETTEGMISYKRVETILNAPPSAIEVNEAREFAITRGRVELRNVSFGYDKRMILDNLSFSVDEGSFVGLVGPSGCGKTTIINLILRLYSPIKGEILIDDCCINKIKSKTLYEQIGMVLQEPYLWNDSIKNNILYAEEGASFTQVQEAAKIACIDDFVEGLRDGYNTIIGENACKISEGQKQRIAIARAVIKKPRILILDEALSSVDCQKENLIINNLRAFLKGTTIIMVSHRVATIEKMDVVYFLADPGKMEISTHDKLISQAIYQKYVAQSLGC